MLGQICFWLSRLNLTNTERVKVHDFIEAIMRMKRPVQGLDVAVAKSLMRRLILEVEDLATNCVRCQDCFRGVSEKLREAALVPEAPPEADQRAKKYCDDLLRRNRALEVKIASMKAFIQHAREQQAKEEEDDGMGPGHSFANVSGFGKDDGAVPRDSARSGARGSWAEAPAVRRSLAELPRPRSCSPGLHHLSHEMIHQQGLIAALRQDVESCKEQVAALKDCLQSKGVVDSVRFLVHLHRHKFESACAAYGLGPRLPLDFVIDIRAVAMAVGSYAGYSAMRALREACAAVAPAAADALELLCPGHLYLCGGFEGWREPGTYSSRQE
eukprot:g12915.t1